MFLLNLNLAELLGLFGAISSVVVLLYLLDRHKRRQVVATLRFWTPSEKPVEMKHRRRIQQPWSLLLQILSILLLLLALAQLRWGSPENASRRHVLILDTSAWMGARGRSGRLIDEARAAAKAYLRAIPSSDEVMVVRADALATPATPFESNRKLLEDAIDRSAPASTALNLDQALEFARQIRRMDPGRAGEVVFAGAGRIAEHDVAGNVPISSLRVLPVTSRVENCGLRKIGLHRSASDPDVWEIFVAVRNYGSAPRATDLSLNFGGAPVGSRRMILQPGVDENATFQYRTRAGGWLEARLAPSDAFPGDDRAVLEVPSQKPIRVTVYTADPNSLQPLLAGNPRVQATFRSPEEFRADAPADILIFDRFKPPSVPAIDSVWIEPPSQSSPIPIRAKVENAAITRWRSDHPLGAGLRTRDLKLESSEVFEAAPSDISVAEVQSGPIILARPAKPRVVVLGFHPMKSALKYELATPLLFANILRWMSPDIFRHWELNGGSVGSVAVTLDKDVDAADVRVAADNQKSLPFTAQGRTVRFFAGTPGTYRVTTGDRDMVYSLTLPEVASAVWEPPASARRGVPRRVPAPVASRDVWQVLALLGGAGLLAEWLLFGRYKGALRQRAAYILPLSRFLVRKPRRPVRRVL